MSFYGYFGFVIVRFINQARGQNWEVVAHCTLNSAANFPPLFNVLGFRRKLNSLIFQPQMFVLFSGKGFFLVAYVELCKIPLISKAEGQMLTKVLINLGWEGYSEESSQWLPEYPSERVPFSFTCDCLPPERCGDEEGGRPPTSPCLWLSIGNRK